MPDPQYHTNLTRLRQEANERQARTVIRRLADRFSPKAAGLTDRQPDLTRRWATVAAVNSDGTVTISIDGVPLADPNGNAVSIVCLASYSPVSGDAVILDFLGDDPLVIGATAAARGPTGFPPGAMLDYAGGTVGVGWLLTDGASYATAAQPALFAAIGYRWGGSGANFNVPDFRSRVALGAGQGAGLTNRVLGAAGGEETHVLLTGELASHTHTMANNAGGLTPGSFGITWTSSTEGLMTTPSGTKMTGALPSSISTNSAGSGTGHNNMQPFAVVTKIIKT